MTESNAAAPIIIVCYSTESGVAQPHSEQLERWVELHRPNGFQDERSDADVIVHHHVTEARITYAIADSRFYGSNRAEEIDVLLLLLTLARWIGDRFDAFWLDPTSMAHQLQPPPGYRVVVLEGAKLS